ncbi:RHS repeat protein [Flavivirga spongiicola]|uniref:RHS repeat-associated core domain-containing protein n=1 Tax=Flavivirga spongiicola TaxID=421621 RepID=A0ABU7XP83_9FLAO|nr:3-coathanger stack domain-containing protein [Flavivirga sp. MEBiC05379]MDO5981902.1 hypothetical protein [Flavivirga sp. MEBiC05379]
MAIDGVDHFLMSLDAPLPTTGTITNVSFDYTYNNEGNTIVGQTVKVTWLTAANQKLSTIGTVQATEETLLNFLCCGDINDYYGEEFINTSTCSLRADLEDTFEDHLISIFNDAFQKYDLINGGGGVSNLVSMSSLNTNSFLNDNNIRVEERMRVTSQVFRDLDGSHINVKRGVASCYLETAGVSKTLSVEIGDHRTPEGKGSVTIQIQGGNTPTSINLDDIAIIENIDLVGERGRSIEITYRNHENQREVKAAILYLSSDGPYGCVSTDPYPCGAGFVICPLFNVSLPGDPHITECLSSNTEDEEIQFEAVMKNLFNEILEYRTVNQVNDSVPFRIDGFPAYVSLKNQFAPLKDRWVSFGATQDFSEDEVYAVILNTTFKYYIQIQFSSSPELGTPNPKNSIQLVVSNPFDWYEMTEFEIAENNILVERTFFSYIDPNTGVEETRMGQLEFYGTNEFDICPFLAYGVNANFTEAATVTTPKFKPVFVLRKMITAPGGAHKYFYKDLEFIPNGFSASIDELINLEVDINFSNYSENPEDYNSAEIILNGKSYKLSNNGLTFNVIDSEQVGYRRPPINRLSWDYQGTWGATFDIFNFSYNLNGEERVYHLNEGSKNAVSTNGKKIKIVDDSIWFTDPIFGTGLRFENNADLSWYDDVPFIYEEGVDLTYKASFKIQDVLPITDGNGYGFITQIDHEDPLNTENLYQLEIYATNGDNVIPENCSEGDKVCVAQPVEPVSCTDKFAAFTAAINGVSDTEQQGMAEEDFCNNQYAYITDDYIYYLTKLGVANADQSIHYITIAEFGATEFGYGYEDPDLNIDGMKGIIDAYAAHVTTMDAAGTSDDIKTWAQFTSDQLYLLTAAGTTCISLPAPLPITTKGYQPPTFPEDPPCVEFAKAIYNSYRDDAYEALLDKEREDFINAYLKNAVENAVENFSMKYHDKEYQYTLYYYDQAGNLSQTVPPEGVNRFTNAELIAQDTNGAALNDRINIHRKNNETDENTTLLPPHDYKTQYAYNSLNQLVWQFTPDGGETRFAYDALGRIVASQNAKQLVNNTFSYTVYDALGRIAEAGELVPNKAIAINQTTGKLIETATGDPIFTDGFSDDNSVILFPKNVSDQQNEVTRTKYNIYISDPSIVFKTLDANSLTTTSRNRVTEVYYFDTVTAPTTSIDFDNAMYYNYDIHGNVKELVHHNRLLAKSSMPYSGLKRVEYEYDLISGNVNKVYYQKDSPDQFIHQYTYDADNRITAVQTSSDGYIWEQDASYDYYAHGPLARTELGDKKVQGQDYAYTIQGWLKGVNADVLNPTNDLGKDGDTDSNIAKDAYGYALTYNDADYEPVGTITAFVNSDTNGVNNIKNLYNGNIKQMVTDVMDTNETALGIQVNHYEYDQLNRIKSMQGYHTAATVGNENYYGDYKYDNNGNLKTLNRKAHTGQSMDQLGYDYAETKTNPLTGEETKNNQLTRLEDQVGDLGLNDLGTPHNYEYDTIGQLISDLDDEGNGITNINWRVDGKVASIIKTGGTEIHFRYDGLGNRIAKTVLPENETTVYTRDAQGNVLAVYETNEVNITNITANKTITLKEHHIYGSSRLGIEQKNISIPEDGDTLIIQENLVLTTDNITTTEFLQAANKIDVAGGVNTYVITDTGNVTMRAGQVILKPGFSTVSGANFLAEAQNIDATLPENTFARKVGDKRFELSNHLGNVLSVVSDRKLVDDPLNFTNFTADVLTYNDYYPFGMLLPNRHGSSDSYRYGFQGQEKDDEVKGEGNSLNYTFRMHDPRVGRFFAVDPLTREYPHYTPYSFSGNKVIAYGELEGLEEYHYTISFTDIGEPILELVSVNDFVNVNSFQSFLHTLTFGLTEAPPVNPFERHIVHSGESVDYFFDGGPYGAGFHEEEVNLNYTSKAELIAGLSTIKEDLTSRRNLIENSVKVGQALSTVASEQQHYGTGARVKTRSTPNKKSIVPNSNTHTFNGKTFNKTTSPIVIPKRATVVNQIKTGYTQVKFNWKRGKFKYEARWHTRTPGAPNSQGDTWVITRTTPGNAQGQRKSQHVLTGKYKWTPIKKWQEAVKANQNGTATGAQQQLLKDGHHQ